jgi:hypothetical protein
MTNKPYWLIVHHTGSTDDNPHASTRHHTFEMVNQWHGINPNIRLDKPSSLGYWIGYHYFIEADGKITQGRLDTDVGAHTRGRNYESIGICLAMNADVELPTDAQKTALAGLLAELSAKWGIPRDRIVPHRKFAPKTCYGLLLPDNWARDLVKHAPETPQRTQKGTKSAPDHQATLAAIARIVEALARQIALLTLARKQNNKAGG